MFSPRLAASLGLLVTFLPALHSAQSTYRNTILADNPIGYWQFDETTGTTAADTGGGTTENGTYENCVLGQTSAFIALGTAASFNGSSSRVRVEPSSVFELGTGDFSVELWYQTAATGRGDLFNYKNAYDFGIFANNAGSGSIGGWHNALLNGTTTTLNAWHHVVVTRTAGTALFYLDGVQVAATADATSFSANAPLFIGANHSGATAYTINSSFNGQIDEVAVYGSALSAARVLAHFQAADTAILPVAVNTPATSVLASSAVIGGQLTTVGNPSPTVTLFWGDNDAGTAGPWDNSVVLGTLSTNTPFTSALSGLSPATTYHYRVRAVNTAGTAWAPSTATFTTGVATSPTVVNLAPSGVTGGAATLRGQVTSTGNDTPTVKIYFGTTDGGTNPASWAQVFTLPPQSSAFSQLASPLSPQTTYHYRCWASNSAGSAWAPSTEVFSTPVHTPVPIVINEIHYNEDDPTVHSEFIELHNPGASSVDLSGWFFDQGINFTLPAGSVVPAGGYLVVCEDPATLLATWGVSGATVVSWQDGPTKYGSLSNSGETIRLRDPLGTIVDEVDYQLGFPWPTVGDTPSYSIELIHPSLDNSLGGNWRRSDGGATALPEQTLVPAGSASWHYRKALSEPSSPIEAWRTVGFSEDASWLTSPGGAPFGYGDPSDTVLSDMRNASSPPGYTGVYFRHTFTTTGPVSGTLKLRVWADDGYIAWINGQEVDRRGPAAGAAIPYNGTAGRNHEAYNQAPEEVTISAPNSILNVGTNILTIHALNESLNGSSDFWLDADLKIPAGTAAAGPSPRAANTVLAANAPPAVRQVAHTSAAPVAGQPWMPGGTDVLITARVTDPDGVASASLLYQIVEPGDFIKIDDPRYEAPASWNTLAMNDSGTGGDALPGDGLWSATIPANVQTHRRLIRYRITAADTAALSVRAPYLDDPQPNFAYFVYNSIPDWTGAVTPGSTPATTYTSDMLSQVQPFHLITTPAEHAGAQAVPVVKGDGSTQAAGAEYTHSLYNWKGALCYDGKVYDHIRFRARGGVWRFEMGKNMWKFDFNKGHDLAVRDNRGAKFGQAWKKLNFSSLIQQGDFNYRGEQGLFESVGFRLFQLAGVPAENTSFAHFRIIERASETNGTASQYDDDFQGLYLAIEQQDGQFLDEHGLPDGNLYKMESGTGELNHQGTTQPKNKSDLTAFQAYTQTEAWWRANCDLENYYDLRAIIDAIHHYDIGDDKNFFYYHNSVTNKWTQLPWDLDLTWDNNMYRGDTGIAGLAPSGNTTEPFFSRIWAIPALRQELQNRVREVHDLLWNTEQVGMLLDETASFIYQPGQPSFVDADRAMWDWNPILTSANVSANKAAYGRFYQSAADSPDGTNTTPQTPAGTFPGMIQKMKSYVTIRRAVVQSQILTDESVIPAKPVATLPVGSLTNLPTSALTFSSSAFSSPGGSAFAAMKWRLAEVTDPAAPGFLPYGKTNPRLYEIESAWESPEITTFAATVTVPPTAVRVGHLYRLRVRHKDAAGRWSHWSSPLQFTAAEPDITPYLNGLVVSKIMYHPASPTGAELSASLDAEDFEWVEILNVGSQTLDLSPVRFTKGVDFDFATGAVTSLAPGARALAVKNTAAFTARHGSGLPVAGEFSGNLANGGEQLKLSYGTGTAIRDFEYDDDAPWPTEPDGLGVPLVLVNPASLPDHASALSWRAGLGNGFPGASDQGSQATYAAWAAALSAGPADADDDGDGQPNLVEHFFGTNPKSSSPKPCTLGFSLDADPRLTLSFTRRLASNGSTWTVERSANLTTWSSAASEIEFLGQTANPDGTATLNYRSKFPRSAAPVEFLRVVITSP